MTQPRTTVRPSKPSAGAALPACFRSWIAEQTHRQVAHNARRRAGERVGPPPAAAARPATTSTTAVSAE